MYTDISPIEKIINRIENRDVGIPKYTKKVLLFRFMMLLREFRRNHMRVSNILQRMKDIFNTEYTFEEGISDESKALARESFVKEDISNGLKALSIERLISEDQYNKLMAMIDELDMKKLVEIVMSEKVGRGIDFLPRKTKDLKKKLYDWAISYSDGQQPGLKSNIIALLDELRFRKAISKQKHNNILKDMN